nr:interleukin-27 receptor subunit alpha isoform X1 [Caretta caretta]XP_048688049.1 interleukin-27 receptor subunit alpha isoform X1 [Caretta caretta]XP_048688051.1 interleukin-27 receptor subunit alpha isoform X1 [Caretta caretta]XP_048688052.1 interleukin-27 receptor subunit alpha isoform X1 [Caretta caretta]XP_048688053.1 interleukin-27 receptor subunit alpha isoform X1 [Caretta caretta]XP_048688054.1 interleukin-27 receptor subunit alpha isoform X1 [Caretta caretta]XP_048688055.1 interleu
MRKRWRGAWLLLLALKTFGFQEGDPEEPTGLECYQVGPRGGMNCTWPSRSGSEAITTYTLHYQSLKFKRNQTQSSQAPAGQSWVVIGRSNLTRNENYAVWVEAGDGTQITPRLTLTLHEIVKPDPPVLSLEDVTPVVTMSWTNPQWPEHFSRDLACHLRYRVSGTANWTRVHEGDVEPNHYEFSSLEPFTAYEVQARCIPEDGKGFWSDWSPSQTFQTPEAAPLGLVDVWQVASPAESGEPSLLLLWKPLNSEAARGVIRSYSLAFRTGSNGAESPLESPCCNASLPARTTHVWISANNHVGRTQPANLSLERQDLPAPAGVQAVAMHGQDLRVTWEPSKDPLEGEPTEYLVEWAKECSSSKAASLGWVRRAAGVHSALLTGDFRPRVPYQVRVYGLYPGGFGASAPVRAYTQEGVPSAGPQGLQDRSISKEVSVISWEAIPLAQRNGHITHYTLYLAVPTGSPQTYQPIAATETSYNLSGLEPGTSYQLWMTGSTSAGEGNASSIHLFHTPDSRWEAVLASLLAVGFLLFLACVLGAVLHVQLLDLCHKVLPSWCWEKIPDATHSRIMLHEVNRDPHSYRGPLVRNLDAEETPITELDIGEPAENVNQGYSTLPQLESPLPALPHSGGADDWTGSKPRTEELVPSSPTLEETWGDKAPVISGYEKHFMPTPEEVLGLA